MAAIDKKLGKVLRRLRKKQGYNQEEFADFASIERAYYGRLERGEHSPTLDKLESIVKTLNIQWSTLFKYLDR